MANYPDILQLIPHGSEFTLLDKIIEIGSDYIITAFEVSNKSDFLHVNKNLPTYTGIEFMAQSIAAYSGYVNKNHNKPIKIGFLLGTRSFDTKQANFKRGVLYLVKCHLLFEEDGLGAFDCSIQQSTTAETICNAKINVYQPDLIEDILKQRET